MDLNNVTTNQTKCNKKISLTKFILKLYTVETNESS